VLDRVAMGISQRAIARHLERLVGARDPFGGRARLEAAADYIVEAFERHGVTVTEERFPFDGLTYRNLVASLPGSSSTDQVLIVAHYDTVPDSPGADDNASGIAGLLEAAALLARHQFQKTLRFVAVPLEECGYVGSLHYVQQAKVRDAAITGAFVLEMIGYTSSVQAAPPGVQAPPVGNFVGVVGNRRSEHLVVLFKGAAARFVPSLPVEGLVVEGNGEAVPMVRRSDHVPFWDAGYPAVMITDTAFLRNPHYHQPSDTLDTLDLVFLRNVAAATAAAAGLLAVPV
jgi:Zn-dependent M28 family amino/carboxypeptidase